MPHVTLTPAYGRDYKSKKEIAADLLADRDFMLCHYDGRSELINWSQLLGAEFDGYEINVRYARLRKVCVLPRDGRKLGAIRDAKPRAKKEPAPLTEQEKAAYEWLIGQIMGSVHVATSDADVRKRIWRGKPGRALQRAKFSTADQAWAEWYALQCHEHNRRVYRDVMGGM